MTDQLDPYPTRLKGFREPVRRQDPVVHARHHWRWEGPLDEVALSRYEHDGFLWFEGFFSRDRTEPLFEELRRMAGDEALLRSERVLRDPASGALHSVFGVHAHSAPVDRLARDPRLLGIIRQLLGSEVYLHQSRLDDKYGFQGSGLPWHSDYETWHAEDGMPRMRAVCATLMLTASNEFNGPTLLIPGSHRLFVPCTGETPAQHWKTSLTAQRVGLPDREALAMLVEHGGIRAPKGPAGSLLLVECNMLHAANENLSPWPRSSLFFAYNSVENLLEAPYAAPAPRPEFLATRRHVAPLTPHDDFPELADQGVPPLR